jgi:hypothetical protein
MRQSRAWRTLVSPSFCLLLLWSLTSIGAAVTTDNSTMTLQIFLNSVSVPKTYSLIVRVSSNFYSRSSRAISFCLASWLPRLKRMYLLINIKARRALLLSRLCLGRINLRTNCFKKSVSILSRLREIQIILRKLIELFKLFFSFILMGQVLLMVIQTGTTSSATWTTEW